ncbi:hypothetical protein CDL15_Pgr001329 [Punica granatum]|uniref:Uncharacterized protein n=1 Tax=Punica granatum TaxID=22663 RepID=A0A218WK89_PUNGR|nr:hypothetical protein CDL15_Pgr001329 [Punica granatum]
MKEGGSRGGKGVLESLETTQPPDLSPLVEVVDTSSKHDTIVEETQDMAVDGGPDSPALVDSLTCQGRDQPATTEVVRVMSPQEPPNGLGSRSSTGC